MSAVACNAIQTQTPPSWVDRPNLKSKPTNNCWRLLMDDDRSDNDTNSHINADLVLVLIDPIRRATVKETA
jgi:hypothetical protein